MRRRPLLLALPWLAAAARADDALPPRKLVFPRDHGAHPELRTEWWYITGQVAAGGRVFGFQVTFFRSRVDATQQMRSRFAAKQLLFAHAAVTDVQGRKLWHDQRIARAGFGVAEASEQDAALVLQDWSLRREGEVWVARLPATDFALELRCTPTQPVLLQGAQGLSRKGPEAAQASYYYSLPQLATAGRLTLRGANFDVAGKAWLDHEWSEALLHPEAVGWDWIGMNLDDGSALTAFRLRRKDGSTLWDGGSYRSAKGDLYIASPGETQFSPQRKWTSPASNATYPVEWILRTPADFYRVRAVVDNQELDSRGSTGAIYWEGLAELIDSNARVVGRGYLEMTGYASRLRL
ncbi:carotenoid 1,2-hydratase [Ramlibacter sp. XY19]|uniref:lipocalin-like domain-containing protein n=1 Tax=Ramlibacter paludis TaxID=2908000 RepID=UPI0023DC7A26|nr:carotenoid 1,2-hydratase [Ramlibacter paludis]MCG2593955.1 carotenoid 1,2-hydratase [Ramlibacter paludis]